MKNLHVNIGGPRDRARQQVSFNISQGGEAGAIDAEQVGRLIAMLREGLEQSALEADELRRARRHITAIEEETQSERPVLSEISDAVSFLGTLVETAQGLAPLFSQTFRLLSVAVGLPLVR